MDNQKKSKTSRNRARNIASEIGQDRGRMALIQVFKNEQTRTLRRCQNWLLNPIDAEDAVQDTFLRAVRAWPRFRANCKIETWIYLISLNVCRNLNRRSVRRKTWAMVEYKDELSVTSVHLSPQPFQTAEVELSFKEFSTQIQAALGELSESSQTLLRLKISEGWTYEKLSAHMGIAPGTVKSRLFRARREVRQRIDSH